MRRWSEEPRGTWLSRYSEVKFTRFPDRLEGIKSKKAAPVHVQLIPSDLCNQACSFCAYRDPGYTSSKLFHVAGNYNPNRKMPIAKALEVLEDCAEMGVRAVSFTGGGEPTVHPDLQKMMDRASELGLRWSLVTNGVLLNKFDVSKAAWVRISLDAATAKTYSSIRKVPEHHFDRALASVKGNGVGFVVTPENWREVVQATILVKSWGAKYIRIGSQVAEDNVWGQDLDLIEHVKGLCRVAELEAGDGFEVFNRFERVFDGEEIPEDSLCGYQYFTTYIGADQNLYRCCVYAYNPRGLLGTIKDKRFKEAWEQSDLGIDARACRHCNFRSINKKIVEHLAEDPSAVFV